MAWCNFLVAIAFFRHIGKLSPHLGIIGDPRKRGEHGGIAPTDNILNGKYRFV
jgi:hypothetical protein